MSPARSSTPGALPTRFPSHDLHRRLEGESGSVNTNGSDSPHTGQPSKRGLRCTAQRIRQDRLQSHRTWITFCSTRHDGQNNGPAPGCAADNTQHFGNEAACPRPRAGAVREDRASEPLSGPHGRTVILRNRRDYSSRRAHIGFPRRRAVHTMQFGSPPPPSGATTTTTPSKSGVVRSATVLARESQCHRPKARRPRRSVMDTSDSVTRSSFSSDRQMRSSPERMASRATVSSRPQIRPNTPSVRLIMRW